MRKYGGIWVFCQQDRGRLSACVPELLAEARRLAAQLGCETGALLLSAGEGDLAPELGGYGADRVYEVSHPALAPYTAEAYATALVQAVEEYKPEILLFAATQLGRELAPRCAALLRTGLTADCTRLDIDMEEYRTWLGQNSGWGQGRLAALQRLRLGGREQELSRELKMTRPAFGGHLLASIVCPLGRPCLSTVRPGLLPPARFDPKLARACQVTPFPPRLRPEDRPAWVLEQLPPLSGGQAVPDITAAPVLVCVGRGIGRDVKTGLALAGELARLLGGEVAASRAAVDAGWLPAWRQVGQTGKTVRPRLYIGLGVSGSIQHQAGMQGAERILALEQRRDAPLCQLAHWAICGDLFHTAPQLIARLRELQAKGGSK